jgi:hypothetical protein
MQVAALDRRPAPCGWSHVAREDVRPPEAPDRANEASIEKGGAPARNPRCWYCPAQCRDKDAWASAGREKPTFARRRWVLVWSWRDD